MVTLSVASHLGGFDLEYSNLEEQEREKILQDACTLIEQKLSDMKYLGEFSWNGKQAFYNDETAGGKGYIPASSNHLSDSFRVTLDAGYSNFIISNSKEVYSSKGKYNLFELLWHGFSAWRATTTPHTPSDETMAYYMRTKKMQRKLRAMNGPMVEADTRISFYYRYASKWFYNMTERRGMDASLVDKFHTYIDRAVSRGIEEAIESNTSGDAYDLMRGDT